MEIKPDNTIIANLKAGQIAAEQPQKQVAQDQALPAAQLSDDFGKLQEQALQLTDDAVKVEQARQDLLNGELDSREAILSAAENLLTLGL